jgi:predicted Zn-dependent protease
MQPPILRRSALPSLLSSLLSLALVASLALLFAGCGGKDKKPKPRKQVLLTTEYADEMVGAEAAKSMAAEMGLIEDPKLLGFVRALGKRLVLHSPQRKFDYTFHIIDQGSPNAFALPGGYIYVSRGLLQLSMSEDELACVIGHEITHAAERHSASSQAYQQRLSPLSMGYMRAMQVAQYGQNHERDADRGGQIIASRAGYDPIGMSTFLKNMDAMDRLQLGWSRLPSFFASHPATPERSATASERANNLKWTRKPGLTKNREDYLRTFEGLILGTNPKEGIFRGNRFFHPDLNFSLRFPEGWQLVNNSQAVGAVAPRGEAMIMLMMAGQGNDAEAVAKMHIEKQKEEAHAKIIRQGPVMIGDIQAYRVEQEAQMGRMKTGGSSTFIPHEGLVFKIDTISRAREADKYAGRGRSVTRSFRSLTEEEADSFFIVRLRIARALEGESIEQLSQRTGNALPVPATAIMNDVFIDSRMRAGQLIKVGIAEPYIARRQGLRPADPKEG